MQFLNPNWLHGLWAVLFLFLFFVWSASRKRALLSAFAENEAITVLAQSHSRFKERLKKGLMIGMFILIVIALAQPQWGEEKKEVKRKGVEVFFLVDTSLSMLAEDLLPNRLEKVKLELKSFLKFLKGDRVGIITFAGTGFIQSPLTLDYDAFLLFAHSVQVGHIPDAGTSLSEAIETAVRGFPETKRKNHAVILLSDGEHQEGDVQAAVRAAKEAKIRIYTIGFGTKEGAPIPLRSEEGKKVSGFKKDREGGVVITKLNEDLLRQIAEDTGGLYFPATPSERETEWIYQHMQNLEKKEFKQKLVVERENHFQLFLGLALILLILELWVGETRKREQAYV